MRHVLSYFLTILALVISSLFIAQDSYAQSKYTNATSDSITLARQRQVDSMKAEHKRIADSTTAARKHIADSTRRYNDSVKVEQARILDSTRLARQHRLDSLAEVRAYRNSKQYKDSMELVKQQRLDSMKNARMAYNDSVRKEQQKILDSTIAERKRVNDSAKLAQKNFLDSMTAERIRVSDSLKAELTKQKEERQKILDSTVAARKIISDSLAKVREERKLAREENAKKKEQKLKLKLELEIEKERAAYTNETLRKKGWGPLRRLMQNTTTRYNYVYNANLKMNQALQNMQRNTKDSFNDYIRLFSYDPKTDSTRYKGDMDTIIKKAAVGIQIHDPRAKWQDDLYLLVGQAYYYKGDYDNASAAFKYIIAENQKNIKEQQKKDRAKQKSSKKEPTKPKVFATVEETGLKGLLTHTAANNEAMMWLSRTFVAEGKYEFAQMMVDLLRNDANFPKHLEGRLALEQANIHLAMNDYSGASEALAKVMHDSDLEKNTRTRAAFLNGQILQKLGKLDESTQAYELALGMHPNLSMSFNAQMAIAMNGLQDSSAKGNVNSVLAKMTKDDKYAPYYDQIYYVLGNNALDALDTAQAEEYLQKSLAKNTNNAKQKGLTFSAIGDLKYQQQAYEAAIQAYDSATLFLTKLDQPAYDNAVIRSRMLDKVVAPAAAIRTNDSLLRLAAMTEPDQRAYIKNYISDLEKYRLDSLYKAQNMASIKNQNNNAMAAGGNGTWYFANPSNVQKGAQEFTKKWGNIQLKDNWRRSSNMALDANDMLANESEKLSPEEQIRANLPNPDSLFALIPKSNVEKQVLLDILENNLYTLGRAYFYDLEDAPKAIQAFDTLDAKFKGNRFLPETTYLRYLHALRTKDQAFADEYYKTLTSIYANEKWTQMLTAQGKDEGSNSAKDLDAHYEQTYDALVKGEYESALKAANEVAFKFATLGKYTQKYELVKAMAYASMQDFLKADTVIKAFLTRFGNDSLGDWGRQVLNYIQRNLNYKPMSQNSLTSSGGNAQSTSTSAAANTSAVNTSLGNAAISGNAIAKVDKKSTFVYDANKKHYIILIGPSDGRINNVKTLWTNYNNKNYASASYKIGNVTIENNHMVYMREASNAADAKQYMNSLKQQEFTKNGYNPGELKMMTISESNFGILLSEKNLKDYTEFYQKHY